jgi:hypothetical protein
MVAPEGETRALIKCPECSGTVPTNAASCPHCGAAVEIEDVEERKPKEDTSPSDSRREHLREDLLRLVGFLAGAVTWLVAHVFFFGYCYILGGRPQEGGDSFDVFDVAFEENPLGLLGTMISLALGIFPYLAAMFVYNKVRWGYWWGID